MLGATPLPEGATGGMSELESGAAAADRVPVGAFGRLAAGGFGVGAPDRVPGVPVGRPDEGPAAANAGLVPGAAGWLVAGKGSGTGAESASAVAIWASVQWPLTPL